MAITSLTHTSALWFTFIGALLIAMTIISASLKRLPFTAAIIYLVIGSLLGNLLLGYINVDPVEHATPLRMLAEMAIIISLFTAGLKLRLPFSSPEWKIPILLATVSMAITVFLVALCASHFFELPWGAAILLGAILAPTDPVLAASVQVLGPEDSDRLRFSLTGEAGLNDGTALPLVLLGLNLLGNSDGDGWLLRWASLDLVWGTIGGIGLGTLLGAGIGRVVVFFREKHQETRSLDDFLALGLVALSYGISLLFYANGFLAVFAAGLALRRRERTESRKLQISMGEGRMRTDTPTGLMALGLLEFNEQIERVGELVVVVLIGAMLSTKYLHTNYFLMALFLLLIARPVAVLVALPERRKAHKILLGWFGIRGVGSLFYLTFAIEHGISPSLANELIGITLSVILASILIHGITATPLMIAHSRRQLSLLVAKKERKD